VANEAGSETEEGTVGGNGVGFGREMRILAKRRTLLALDWPLKDFKRGRRIEGTAYFGDDSISKGKQGHEKRADKTRIRIDRESPEPELGKNQKSILFKTH